jgi:hypothetical protein
LATDFEKEGEKVIKPIEYLKLVANLLPKELLITDSVLEDMSDEQLVETIQTVRKLKAEKLSATMPPPADDAVPTKH